MVSNTKRMRHPNTLFAISPAVVPFSLGYAAFQCVSSTPPTVRRRCARSTSILVAPVAVVRVPHARVRVSDRTASLCVSLSPDKTYPYISVSSISCSPWAQTSRDPALVTPMPITTQPLTTLRRIIHLLQGTGKRRKTRVSLNSVQLTEKYATRMCHPIQAQRTWTDAAKSLWLLGANFCETWSLSPPLPHENSAPKVSRWRPMGRATRCLSGCDAA